MIYHIVVGDVGAAPLREAITMEPSMEGEVVVLKDVLSVGPLTKEEEKTFSETRSAFWQQVMSNDKNPVVVDDLERLMQVSTTLSNDEEAKVWMWMAPWPADIVAYYWMLHYMQKHARRMFVVNIAALPFLDENGKVFYPKSIGEILPKELVKARRLARQITPAEVEIDGEEWGKLTTDNAGIRTHEGGKKLTSRSEEHYDNQLISFCSQQFQKGSRIVSQALSKFNIPTGDTYLGWRLRKMAENGRLTLQGDVAKALKDFDVKLPGEVVSEVAVEG